MRCSTIVRVVAVGVQQLSRAGEPPVTAHGWDEGVWERQQLQSMDRLFHGGGRRGRTGFGSRRGRPIDSEQRCEAVARAVVRDSDALARNWNRDGAGGRTDGSGRRVRRKRGGGGRRCFRRVGGGRSGRLVAAGEAVVVAGGRAVAKTKTEGRLWQPVAACERATTAQRRAGQAGPLGAGNGTSRSTALEAGWAGQLEVFPRSEP